MISNKEQMKDYIDEYLKDFIKDIEEFFADIERTAKIYNAGYLVFLDSYIYSLNDLINSNRYLNANIYTATGFLYQCEKIANYYNQNGTLPKTIVIKGITTNGADLDYFFNVYEKTIKKILEAKRIDFQNIHESIIDSVQIETLKIDNNFINKGVLEAGYIYKIISLEERRSILNVANECLQRIIWYNYLCYYNNMSFLLHASILDMENTKTINTKNFQKKRYNSGANNIIINYLKENTLNGEVIYTISERVLGSSIKEKELIPFTFLGDLNVSTEFIIEDLKMLIANSNLSKNCKETIIILLSQKLTFKYKMELILLIYSMLSIDKFIKDAEINNSIVYNYDYVSNNFGINSKIIKEIHENKDLLNQINEKTAYWFKGIDKSKVRTLSPKEELHLKRKLENIFFENALSRERLIHKIRMYNTIWHPESDDELLLKLAEITSNHELSNYTTDELLLTILYLSHDDIVTIEYDEKGFSKIKTF